MIQALSKGEKHVPFRDSKLTHLLKESLGGNSKTTLICTASRKQLHQEESIQSLKFAQRVKTIKNKAEQNIQRSPKEMEIMIRKLKMEIEILKAKLSKAGLSADISYKEMQA